MPTLAPDPIRREQDFVAEVLRGMAALCGGDARTAEEQPGDLAVPLGLSAWIVRAAIGLPDAYDALLRLRAVVVAEAGMDLRSEPVPLRVAESRAALRSLGAYLYGLMNRAARHSGCTPVELAEDVLDALSEAEVTA